MPEMAHFCIAQLNHIAMLGEPKSNVLKNCQYYAGDGPFSYNRPAKPYRHA